MHSKKQAPVLYIPHGGGPLPLLSDPGHAALVSFLKHMGRKLPAPKAILVVSAHWEETTATVLSGEQPPLLFDYYGFPAETYEYLYPAPGAPEVAESIRQQLTIAGIQSRSDSQRGFDHGAFVPLMLMYPDADVPCLELSLLQSMDAREHLVLGKALQNLRSQGVMIMGSGSPFHNMNAFKDGKAGKQACRNFNQWLLETCCDSTFDEAQSRLLRWQDAPDARYAHPREEHLLPLHVCFGAASLSASSARCVFNADVMGYTMSGYLWD